MNRHTKTAILVAPFLAIAGYIAVGYLPSDPPAMRTLVLKDQCQLVDASCVLKTEGLELRLSSDNKLIAGETIAIEMGSSSRLDEALISFGVDNKESRPSRLTPKAENLWKTVVKIEDKVSNQPLRLRLIIGWQGHVYFADEEVSQ